MHQCSQWRVQSPRSPSGLCKVGAHRVALPRTSHSQTKTTAPSLPWNAVSIEEQGATFAKGPKSLLPKPCTLIGGCLGNSPVKRFDGSREQLIGNHTTVYKGQEPVQALYLAPILAPEVKKRGQSLGLKLTPLSTQPLRALSEHEPKESELQEFRTSLVVQWLRL